MTKSEKIYFFALISIVLLFGAYIFAPIIVERTIAGQSDDRAVEVDRYKTFSFFSATTTNATSTNNGTDTLGMDIKGAKKVTFFLTHGGTATTSTGSSRFNVQVSEDEGTTWHNFSRLLGSDVSQTATSSVTIGPATTTDYASLDLHEAGVFSRTRCIVVELGTVGQQGEHTCTASVEF